MGLKEENIEYCLNTFYYPLIDKWAQEPEKEEFKTWFSGINTYKDGLGLDEHDCLERKELLKRLKHYAQKKGFIAYYGDRQWGTRLLWIMREDDRK